MGHIVCPLPLILVFFSCKVRYWICLKIIQTKRFLIPNIQARTWKLIHDMTKANCFYNPTSMDHFIAAMMMTMLSTKATVVSTVYRYVEVNEVKKKNPVLLLNHKT